MATRAHCQTHGHTLPPHLTDCCVDWFEVWRGSPSCLFVCSSRCCNYLDYDVSVSDSTTLFCTARLGSGHANIRLIIRCSSIERSSTKSGYSSAPDVIMPVNAPRNRRHAKSQLEANNINIGGVLLHWTQYNIEGLSIVL